MKQDLLIRNARLVLPDEVVRGSMAITGGVIAAVDSGPSQCLGSEDFEHDLLIPGLVEIHTDNLERHLMPRPKVAWPTMPALLSHDAELIAAGITTVLDAIHVGDIDPEALRELDAQVFLAAFDQARNHRLLRADHWLHIRCELPTPTTLERFLDYADHDTVRLISLMDHTIGQRQWEREDAARVYYTGKKGWSDSKFESFKQRCFEFQGRYSESNRRAIVTAASSRQVPLASHDDTRPEHVQDALRAGVNISEFPTTFAAALTARALGMSIVMGAPNVVRGGSHSGNVAAMDLADHGLLDGLSSDYVPNSLLNAAFCLVDIAQYPLHRAIACVTSQPARMVGMNDRGRLQQGARADLVQVRFVPTGSGKQCPQVVAVWRGGEKVF